jgi:23S rRNA (guanosine2251-2'-O)-methyltransferase
MPRKRNQGPGSRQRNSRGDKSYRKPPSVAPITQREEFLYNLLDELEEPFFLVLDRVQDPHNLGACLRTADCTGVDGIIIAKDRAAPLTDTAVTIARGAAEHVPVIEVRNITEVLEKLKEYGIQIVGCTEHTENDLYDADLTGPLALIMGAEDKGIRRLNRKACDQLVKIPMFGHVNCLNVSVAAGVALYEIVRQKMEANDHISPDFIDVED